ncbi:hypothetical protein [Croceicoccus gelatinilyticus]|uniref:hypothetical protein n=1 Tax=Croceicoccus gelatinilyticus TaxID=2835536 RepID=UPI001BCCE00F|nr:hypothetical protein [Croceicoccus gelatinilyticus]MBS7671519.1 hypothetical protein [Croceicoccus gelatinilyticus]
MAQLLETMKDDHTDRRFYIDGRRVTGEAFREFKTCRRLDSMITRRRGDRWRFYTSAR